MPCGLPVTGANLSMLVTVGLLLIAAGIAFLLTVHARGVNRGAGIVITLAVGVMVLALSGAPAASAADSCAPTAPALGTTTAIPADPSPIAPTLPVATSPGVALPEASQVVAFPAVGLLVMAGYILMRRRKDAAVTR